MTPSQLGLPGYKLVWFRKEINLSGKDLKNDLILHLGKVMTGDVTYFNGVELGREKEFVRNKCESEMALAVNVHKVAAVRWEYRYL